MQDTKINIGLCTLMWEKKSREIVFNLIWKKYRVGHVASAE